MLRRDKELSVCVHRLQCLFWDAWHTDAHLVLLNHKAAAVTGIQAQPSQELQIRRRGVGPLPLLILPGIHIACTQTAIPKHTPHVCFYPQAPSMQGLPCVACHDTLLRQCCEDCRSSRCRDRLSVTWVERADALRGEAVGGLEMLLQP